jgi:hypothetical protein
MEIEQMCRMIDILGARASPPALRKPTFMAVTAWNTCGRSAVLKP